jgi:hypothetical protein
MCIRDSVGSEMCIRDRHRSPSLLRVDSETEMSHRDMQWFLKPHGYNPTTDSLDFKELSQITNIT